MKVSYSKVGCYNDCPFKYKLRYIDRLEAKFDERPNNALVLGTAVHEGIENRSVEKAIESYKSNYSIWNENNEIEVLKLQTILPRAFEQIPEGEYEHKLNIPEEFVGYIDLLVKVGDNTYDMYDFKYSNNASNYKKSGQLHVYKYYYERITGNTIRNMYYILIPKSTEMLTEDVSQHDLIDNITKTLSNADVKFIPIEYDPQQLRYFFARKSILEKATVFEKRYTTMCKYCEFNKYCKTNGLDTSELKVKEEAKPKEEEVVEVQLF